MAKKVVMTEDPPHVDTGNLTSAIINLSRGEVERLDRLGYDEFLEKTNAHGFVDEGYFKSLKENARQRLIELGKANPENMTFGEGTYLVVGDSHGKHTKTRMFNLLKNLQTHLGFQQVIHVGHILDDDNMMSYWWQDFQNLVVVAKREELSSVEKHRVSWGGFVVSREAVRLGRLLVRNQDLITDYVKTPIKTLDQHIFDETMVVNCHRQEWFSRCAFREDVFTVSPGSICERHIVKTIKQIDFTAGYQIREARPDGFIKYRRMRDMYKFWEQGVLIVHVDERGDYTIVPCRIHEVNGVFMTAYHDTIYTENGTIEPTLKVFLNTDVHCGSYDPGALALQDAFVRDFQPDVYVNLGDMQNNIAFNHHIIDRHEPVNVDSVDEDATVFYLLRKMAEWAPVRYLMYGNHERFVKDFVKRMPQYKTMFEGGLRCATSDNDYTLVGHKDALTVGGMRCVHGDNYMFGQSGSLLEKVSRTFGRNTVVGHLHSTSIRFGCYMLGMSGRLLQGYNEEASPWNLGFGTCLQYDGYTWVTPWTICGGKLHTSNKTYTYQGKEAWSVPAFKYRVVYDFDSPSVSTQ